MFDSCLRLSPNRRFPRLAALCVVCLRPACIYARGSRVLFIWPLRLPLRYPPPPPPARASSRPRGERCIEERQRRVFTSLRSHNSDRQTGKPFFLPLCPSSSDFPRPHPSTTFLAISVKYFKDRLSVVHPPPPLLLLPSRASSISSWVYANERLDLAAIPLSARYRHGVAIHQLSRGIAPLLLVRKIDCYISKRRCIAGVFSSSLAHKLYPVRPKSLLRPGNLDISR